MFSLILAASAALAAPAPSKSRVVIDGHVFEVRIKGRSVTVADKALVTKPSPEQGERMRRAVVVATNCRIEEPYWEAAKLRGLLNCEPA